jgi:hypothetical protein
MHMVITLAGHQVESIDEMYFDGVLVPLAINGGGASDGYLHPSSGKYVAHCLVEKHLGDPADTSQPFPALHSDIPSWDSTCLQRGCAKVHVRLKWDADIFPNGWPSSIAFNIKGKRVYDPRTGTTAFSNNSALCLRDYLTDTKFGMGVSSVTIDDAAVQAAANICDENVNKKAGGTQKRYTCDGAFEVSENRADVMRGMLTSMAGYLIPPADKWRMYAGTYRTPSVTLTDSDLRGPIKMDTRISRRDLANAIKGTYVSPDNNWQPSDFPGYKSSAYATEDGEVLWRDISLPFTTDGIRAQRLAKINLERTRRQITLTLPCKLPAYRFQPGDVVNFTHDRFGFSAKPFEVTQTALVQDGNDVPVLGCDLILRETDSDVYAWDEAVDEGTVTAPATTTVPDMGNVGAPSGLSVTSVETTRTDGIKHLQLKVTWTSPTDIHVLSGGHIQVWMQKHTGGTYALMGQADGNDTEYHITQNVIDGEHYDVKICSVNTTRVRSAFVELTNILASASIVAFSGTVTSLDNVNDGTTYAKPLATRINAGKPVIDFAESIHSNKVLDNLADGTYAKPLATRVSSGKPLINFGESIHLNPQLQQETQQVCNAQTTITTTYVSGDDITHWTALPNTLTFPCVIEWDVYLPGSATIVESVLLWQNNDGSNKPNGYSLRCDGRSGQLLGQIIRIASGGTTTIGTTKGPVNSGNVLNQWVHMTARIDGAGQMDIYANGVWMKTANDTTFTPTGPCYTTRSTGANYVIAPSSNKSTVHDPSQLDTNRRALIDFSQSGHTSKNLDNIDDTSTFLRTYKRVPGDTVAICNPDFEQGSSSPLGNDSGWYLQAGSAGNVTYETSGPLAGSRSLKLVGTAGVDTQVRNMGYWVAKPGDQFYISTLCKINTAGVLGNFGIVFIKGDGSSAGASSSVTFTNTSAAVKSLVTTSAPAETVYCQLFIRYYSSSTSNGWVHFDQVRVSPLIDENQQLYNSSKAKPIFNPSSYTSTNPLTQSGTSKTINVAAFTIQWGFGQVSYNSGSVTPANYGTYSVYCDDPTYAGGAVSFVATQTSYTVYAADGRLYLGEITTSSGGGGGGSGGGGGGGCPMVGTEIEALGDIPMTRHLVAQNDWVVVKLENGYELTAVPEHPVITDRGQVRMDELVVGDEVVTDRGMSKVAELCTLFEPSEKIFVAMPEGHLYWANGILSHNKVPR